MGENVAKEWNGLQALLESAQRAHTELLENGKQNSEDCEIDEALENLESDLNDLQEETRIRMTDIEAGLACILQQVSSITSPQDATPSNTSPSLHSSPDQHNKVPGTPTNPCAVVPLQSHESSTPASTSVPQATDPIPSGPLPVLTMLEHTPLWFTKRAYPAFTVILIDSRGRPYTATSNWHVSVRLVSGLGGYADQFLYGPALTFPLFEGRATISGIRVSAVTSRNGGYFELEVALTNPPNSGIAPVRSQKLRILSERLKNESKAASIFDLGPEDSLLRVPGIGKKYRKRFADLGVKTIRDMASLETNTPLMASVLEVVKFERGVLSEHQFAELIANSRAIVDKATFPSSRRRGVGIVSDMNAKRHQSKSVQE